VAAGPLVDRKYHPLPGLTGREHPRHGLRPLFAATRDSGRSSNHFLESAALSQWMPYPQ
jgi:hypothetical protein